MTELLRAGFELREVDAMAAERLAEEWPIGREIPIHDLLRVPREISFLDAGECS